ncbi:hypothetical protein Mal33_13130 [Rosistilla oblonga]|uniref:Uncharacterized protein n=1 Tax=Rosistilla oblonga TaxID=2527990 RepID=A0A518IQI0_9BACT|nr:hypothetical protein Mal33_13130 [Rosistilla oblonga]
MNWLSHADSERGRRYDHLGRDESRMEMENGICSQESAGAATDDKHPWDGE